jgi:hypothetical protein
MGHLVARCVVTCRAKLLTALKELAEPTGLEPATSDVTSSKSDVSSDKTITLSLGGQNILVEQIIKEFCLRFPPALSSFM